MFISKVIILVTVLLLYSRIIKKTYEKDFQKIANVIKTVNEEKSLPELEKLKTWKG
ncbi:MAG: hypothetical protein QG670_2723 [Thermoproteota archaeon]|nr:hypothetical protein [Thermoproteota archaeon]